MFYNDNYDHDEYDPNRVASEAYDDRDEEDLDIYADAGWNDETDPVNHL